MLPAGDILGYISSAGVDQAVLVQSFSAHGYENRYCADATATDPKRFVGVCRIDPAAGDAVESLSYWVRERGMRGVRLGRTDPQTYPLWERAQELGVPVALQVSRSELVNVRRLAERFPGVKAILDHLSHPILEDGPPYAAAADFFALAACPNLHLKFSTMNIREASAGKSTPRSFFETLLDRFGPARLLWGSDFPHTSGSAAAPYAELTDLARETFGFLSASDREQILAGTARSLYPDLTSGP